MIGGRFNGRLLGRRERTWCVNNLRLATPQYDASCGLAGILPGQIMGSTGWRPERLDPGSGAFLPSAFEAD